MPGASLGSRERQMEFREIPMIGFHVKEKPARRDRCNHGSGKRAERSSVLQVAGVEWARTKVGLKSGNAPRKEAAGKAPSFVVHAGSEQADIVEKRGIRQRGEMGCRGGSIERPGGAERVGPLFRILQQARCPSRSRYRPSAVAKITCRRTMA